MKRYIDRKQVEHNYWIILQGDEVRGFGTLKQCKYTINFFLGSSDK